jgi:hypothetical protein
MSLTLMVDYRDHIAKKDNKISDTNRNNSNIPNQHAKVENTLKGEEELQANTNHTFGFIDEYLEEAINTSNIYEYTQKTDYHY